jgi:hypothetical protein
MRITRRQATGFLLATGLSLSPVAISSGEASAAAIKELKLPPEVLAQFEHNMPSVLEEARRLDELPLGGLVDGLALGFVFIPR